MKIVCKETKETFILDTNRSSGIESTKCPKCSDTRKKKNDKCFNWNHNDEVGKCHNCGNAFYLFKEMKQQKIYERPKVNNTELTDEALEYFLKRGISQFTLRQLNVSSGFDYMPQYEKEVKTIHFNFFRGEDLINIKYRAANKKFKLHKDAELIFYNENCISKNKEIIIVEGEVDCLSVFECGFHNCVSVPNGASNFDFLDNYYDTFELLDKVIIAVDNDEKGIELKNELIRRIGQEKCSIVDFKDCKDANDYLLKYGKATLSECIRNSNDLPIDGVTTVENVWEEMIYTFRNGKRHGTTTFFKGFDEHWTWRTSEVNAWTGYANDGKTCFFNQLCVLKAKHDGWKFSIFSPENYPISELYDELIHCYVGKSTDKLYNAMSVEEYEQASLFINDHFFAIDCEDFKIDTVLSKMKYLIKKRGVKGCLIDPYNQIEHEFKNGEQEHLYVSRFMTILKRFAVNNDVSMNLIAHQVTPKLVRGDANYPKPDMYNIKGGGTFTDKVDNVISVWRPFRLSNIQDPSVMVIVGKVKKQRLVGVPGEFEFTYDFKKNQYFDGSEMYIPEQKDINARYEKEIQPNFDFSDTQIEKESPF
jgi:twinkle protein